MTHGVVAPEAQAAKARKAAEKDEELDIMEIIKVRRQVDRDELRKKHVGVLGGHRVTR